MQNDLNFLTQVINKIVANVPNYSENSEEYQEEINRSLNTLRNAKEPLLNNLKQLIKSMIPNDNLDAIKPLEARLDLMNQYFHLANSVNNPLEEMGFNDLLYKLSNPIDLVDYNENLLELIKKFNNVGIKLTIKDFSYSYFVKKVMAKFFENIDNPNLYEEMKNIFDKVYWRNHHILMDITINIRDLLILHEKNIQNYALNLRNNFIKKNKIVEKNMKEEYEKLFTEVINLSHISSSRVYSLFKRQGLNIDDYQDDSPALESHLHKFISKEDYEKIRNQKEEDKFFLNIEELDLNLYEYENYEKFKFLITEIKTILERKSTITNDLNNKKKTITNLKNSNKKNLSKLETMSRQKDKLFKRNKEKQLMKLTKKIEDLISTNDNVLSQIRLEYNEYDDLVFAEKVCKLVNEGMSVYNIFNIYKNDLNALRKSINKQVEEPISEASMLETVTQFVRFMKEPRIKIINTINYLNEDPMDVIIEDKYKLLGITVDIVMPTEQVYKDLRKSCAAVATYNYIYRSGWTPYLIQTKIKHYDDELVE